MRKIEQITANIQADKELLKRINAASYTSVVSFIENAERYIKAIKERRMLCTIKSVSSSGMSRVIKFVEVAKRSKSNEHNVLNFYTLFQHLGYTEAKSKDGFRVSGCGMDMVFHTNYTIIHKLHRLGFITRKECDVLAQKTPSII